MQTHAQRAFPARPPYQVLAQLLKRVQLAIGEALVQALRIAVVLHQVGEGMIAFVHLQVAVEYGNGGGHTPEDFLEARLALAQGPLGIAHPQQGAQGGQQHIRVYRVDQIGISTGIQAGNDIAALDRCRRHVDHRQQRRAAVLTQQPDNVETAHVRQVDVEDQCIHLLVANQRQPLPAGARLKHFVTVRTETTTQGVTGGDVVVDDQQAQRRGSPTGSSKIRSTAVASTIGRNIPRSAANRSNMSNQAGEMVMRPASILARSSRSSTMSDNSRVALLTKATWRCCSSDSGPSSSSASRLVMLSIEPSGVRNSWLMYDRKRLFRSDAWRKCSAWMSSSAYRASTP
ncbi:hypothetical protein WR25_02885 [Diploscapter pachys]|uniref:Uncharacterized protein n=1 Tax=Diploscapter pachys TaxID=2018661 RepID=A0A2A2K8Q9_9BILA|nr:hypothetical protein WR25_02885 [Diploscapter pachys]